MKKKERSLIQSTIGLLPTALIVLCLYCYVDRKKQQRLKEPKALIEIQGMYFGYIETIRKSTKDHVVSPSDNESFLFQLQVEQDELGPYFTLNSSKEKYYFQPDRQYEFNTRSDTIDEFTLAKEMVTMSISQERGANTIHWSESFIVWDTFLQEMIYESEKKGTLIKKSGQTEIFPMN